jgi:hypothetical protein
VNPQGGAYFAHNFPNNLECSNSTLRDYWKNSEAKYTSADAMW